MNLQILTLEEKIAISEETYGKSEESFNMPDTRFICITLRFDI